MNAFIGERLSIITSKAQTTRHRILALINDVDFQLVISDTPGIIKPAHKLHKSMMDFVLPTIEDADILLYMVEYKDHNLKDNSLFNKIVNIKVPLLIILNKIFNVGENILEDWFVFGILLWFFLFILHFISVFITKKFMDRNWERNQIEKLVKKQEIKNNVLFKTEFIEACVEIDKSTDSMEIWQNLQA